MMDKPVILDEDRVEALEELVSFPRVLWLDPGGISGWAVVWFDPDVLFDTSKPIVRAAVAWHAGMWLGTENGHVDAFLRKMKEPLVWGDGLGVGVEDFVLATSLPGREVLSPVRITAKLDYVLARGVRCGGEVRRWEFRGGNSGNVQSAADAKSVVTDSRLKLWQMYLPGKDHPRDAMRHALLYLRRLRAAVDGEDSYDEMHFRDPVAWVAAVAAGVGAVVGERHLHVVQ